MSRPTILKIRAAWVEMYTRMVFNACRKFVEAHVHSCKRNKRPFAVLTFTHIQDEADIRLRSGEARDGPKMPRRARASKVQMHVVTLAAGLFKREIPTELEALGDKTAGTLATVLEGTMRRILQGSLPTTISPLQPEIWALYILVGDAVPTNGAAAKLLWASVQQVPIAERVRFFLLVVVCMVHQVGLTAKNGVIGNAASTAGGSLYKEITGVAARLFKYLLNDYYEEFVTNTSDWVSAKLRVVEHNEADRTLVSRGQNVHGLRELYTDHVVPDTMVALWNNGVGNLSHMLPIGADPVASRPELVRQFTAFLVESLLTPDEHPTLTRFFSYRVIIDAMLTMDLIGMPLEVFKLNKIKPREENQKRLKSVRNFFSDPEAKQVLRRASLVLQLTGGLEAFTAAKPKQEGEGPPPVVAFLKGEAHALVEERLQRLFGLMSNDPLLQTGPAIGNLLGVAADLLLRFNTLLEYPFKLCRMCKRWFPEYYLHNIMSFLHADVQSLDVGVGAQLRDIAFDQRNESQALAWMASRPVQDFLEDVANGLLCHSLEVERRGAQVKHWESSKVTHIATASCNNICVRFAKEREAKALAIEAAMEKLRKAKYMNTTALSWKNGGSDSRGVEHRWKSGTSGNICYRKTYSLESLESTSSGSTCYRKTHSLESLGSTSSGRSGNDCEPRRRQTYPPGSRRRGRPLGSLGKGTKRKRETEGDDEAHNAVGKALIQKAQDELDVLMGSSHVPVTRIQWKAWLDDNIDEFHERMVGVCERRRQGNTRKRARPALPPPAPRIQPAVGTTPTQGAWARNLAGRTGWYGIQTTTSKMMFYLARHAGQTFVIDLEPNRVEGDSLAYVFDVGFKLGPQLQPLSLLEAALNLPDHEVLGAFEFQVAGAPHADSSAVLIKPVAGRRVTEPLKVRKEQPECEEDEPGADAVDVEEGEEDFSSSEAEPVVDTDVESGLDSSSSDDEDPPLKPALPMVAPASEPSKPCHHEKSKRHHHFDNGYFYIAEPKAGESGWRMHVHKCMQKELGCHFYNSKYLTPAHYGEDSCKPVATLLLLRAWMLWRARQDGWATARPSRERQFIEDEAALKRDISKLQPKPGGALGCKKADALLRNWAPSVLA